MAESGKPLLIVAGDVEGEGRCPTLVVNAIRKDAEGRRGQGPFFGDRRKASWEGPGHRHRRSGRQQMWACCCARVGLEVLGSARRVVVSRTPQ